MIVMSIEQRNAPTRWPVSRALRKFNESIVVRDPRVYGSQILPLLLKTNQLSAETDIDCGWAYSIYQMESVIIMVREEGLQHFAYREAYELEVLI